VPIPAEPIGSGGSRGSAALRIHMAPVGRPVKPHLLRRHQLLVDHGKSAEARKERSLEGESSAAA
jgi:hypothetical protein